MAKMRVAVATAGVCLLAACTADPTAARAPSPVPERTAASASPTAPGRTAAQDAAQDATPAPRATGEVAQAPEWKAAPDPGLSGSAALVDVAAGGPGDVWAVGYQDSAEDREGSPAVVRWDGTRWREVPVGERDLYHVEGVSVGGPDDVWIVGNGETAVAARWNGRRWTWERPFGIAHDYRFTDVAVSGGRAWFTANTPSGTVVLEWDDGEFRNAYQSGGTLRAITVKDGHVWAVGGDESGPMVLHGTSTVWEAFRIPDIPGGRLNRVWQISPSDVWAVGEIATGSPDVYGDRPAEPLALHWDGSRWTRAELPVSRGALHGVTAFDGDDVWASGVDADHSGQPLLLHFDGTRWTARYGPLLRPYEEDQQYDVSDDVGHTGIAGVPGTGTVWVVGSVGWGDAEAGFTLRR
ncbi:hypothetical protein GCM10010156_42320 [Planobispora rosea]|uniref:Uncharacterized protein n=1 Tax=Planobispora rosea TaxID=35762 RepID=A0A8J3WFB2_PLARO|nr:hypothetical protein [Planobispora rosea]GGS79078.1 hypothetical protein GCM10010156_42320 [Planobispora rosea]GIH85756.1 hypothetical protein Pro02_41640 [Planobispora rosea]